jgi:hypothetical protein
MKKLVVLLLIATSCSPVYLPNSRNSPMFKDAGEFQFGGSIGNGVEAQSAVSVSNHIGIMANYFYVNRKHNDLDKGEDREKHQLFEGGVGYFYNSDGMFFEIFGGYGQGKGSSFEEYSFFSEPTKATGKYNKIFIQPAFGFNKNSFHLSFVPRVSIIDFTEFNDGTNRIEIDEKSQAFFEPALIGRFNFVSDHIYFQWQTGASLPMFKDPYFDFRSLVISAGLGFRIGGKSSTPKKIRGDI